jgi:hypothetical protein
VKFKKGRNGKNIKKRNNKSKQIKTINDIKGNKNKGKWNIKKLKVNVQH